MSEAGDEATGQTLHVGLGASRRHLAARAEQVCILVRHTTGVLVAALSVLDTDLAGHRAGRLLLMALGVWSCYRLLTRSALWQFTAADVCWIVAIGAGVGTMVSGQAFVDTTSAPEVIVTVAVSTFVIQVRPPFAAPLTFLVVAAYTWGSAQIVGWSNVGRVSDLYYLVASWVMATVIRIMIWRVADAVDRARGERQAAEVVRNVSAARRSYDREQLALLHDTAAATLLMVGQNAEVEPARLAAQAQRDLDVLEDRPWKAAPAGHINVVEVLRNDSTHLQTAVRFTGADAVWLRGELAHAVVAAAREVTNNVDRHAHATLISVDIAPNRVIISDDGVGFTPGPGGYGIGASIVARMNRVGGAGSVASTPAKGTVAELSWPDPRPIAASVDAAEDADRLIGRVRSAYTLAMTGFAVINLVADFPPMTAYSQHALAQAGLALLTGLCALAAVPAVLRGWRGPARIGAFVLAVVAFAQPALLTTAELTRDANWGQAAVGFCLVPLLLAWPTTRAAATLCAYWAGPAVVGLIRHPSEAMTVFLGLSVAGSLVPQLFATLFSSWAAQAAHDARAEHENVVQVVTAEKIARAIQADYLKHYADVMTGVVPLLRALRDGEPITPELRRRSRAESRRLRTLFDQLRADHPLLFELRAIIEAAEDRGVEVSVHFDGALAHLDQPEVERLLRAVDRLIAMATVSARVVVTAGLDEIAISVVCEVGPEDAGSQLDSDGVELVWSDQTAWMTIRHRLPAPQPASQDGAFCSDPAGASDPGGG